MLAANADVSSQHVRLLFTCDSRSLIFCFILVFSGFCGIFELMGTSLLFVRNYMLSDTCLKMNLSKLSSFKINGFIS